MKKLLYLILLMPLMVLFACREDIVIDLEEGDPLIGVEGSITDEYKRHEVVLSYTSEFYDADEIKMISGARVVVTDGVDTIPYLEQPDQPGHYLTDSVAGHKNTLYKLLVEIPDELEGTRHLYAESYMNDNVETIDSLVLKKATMFQGLPLMDSLYLLYPYFQSLPDPSIVYMIKVTQDSIPQNDTLTQITTVPTAGYAGYYVNGPEMLEDNMEIPVCMVFESELHDGMVFRLDLYSIPYDYMIYLYNIQMSMGSNPLLGTPTNIPTNIQPQGSAVGWFYAASAVSKELIYHP